MGKEEIVAISRIDRRGALLGAGAALFAPVVFSERAWAQTKLTKIRIVSSQGNQVAALQELTKQKRWLEEFGIDAEVLTVADGAKLIGALIGGDSDVCIFSGFNQTLAAIEKGAKMKIIGGASITGQQAVFSAKPEIKSVRDLQGKIIGVGALGAQLHQVMRALLLKKGVDLNTVRFVNVGSSADVFRAIVAKTVDAGPAQADIFDQLEKYNIHMLDEGAFANDLSEYTWQASFATDKVIAEKRDTLVRVLAGYCKAYRYVQTDPASKEPFIEARAKALGVADMEVARREGASQWQYVWDNKPYALDLEISPARVEYMQKLNVDVGAQNKVLPYDQVADMSLARQAVKMLG